MKVQKIQCHELSKRWFAGRADFRVVLTLADEALTMFVTARSKEEAIGFAIVEAAKRNATSYKEG